MYNMEGARMMCVYIYLYSVGIYSLHFVHINLPSLVTEAEFDSLLHITSFFFSLSFSVVDIWQVCVSYSIDS